jgi:hypothetical protein
MLYEETCLSLQCSKTCGFGRALREVYCVGTSGQRLAASVCQSKQRPETQRQCYMGPCKSHRIRHCYHALCRFLNNY